MTPYYADDAVTLYHGDCRDVLRADQLGYAAMLGYAAPLVADCSVDAVVCDPPYELAFMGRQWDASGVAYDVGLWRECLRVLKPGGHLLAFGGTRTWHRLACAVEDAGFEMRDSIAWIYAQGFPKSLDVSKAIDRQRDDKADIHRVCAFVAEHRQAAGLSNRDIDEHFGFNGMAGHWTNSCGPQAQVPRVDQWARLKSLLSLPDDMDAEVWRLNGRKGQPGEAWESAEVLRVDARFNEPSGVVNVGQGSREWVERAVKAPNSDAARAWQGWGTALKPAFEPVVVARKPLAGTVAGNVLAYGTGALNIDGCRVEYASDDDKASARPGGKATSLNGALAGKAQACGEKPGTTAPSTTAPTKGLSATSTPAAHAGSAASAPRTEFEVKQGGGRWPANVVLDGAAADELDRQSGTRPSGSRVNGTEPSRVMGGATYGEMPGRVPFEPHDDSGGASRFFPVFRYEAKAPTAERPRHWRHACGCDYGEPMRPRGACTECGRAGELVAHPTVKPLDLMCWLVRLVTPPGGLVLDPFAGSGTTAEACVVEGFRCTAVERDADYLPLIRARLSKPIQPTLLG